MRVRKTSSRVGSWAEADKAGLPASDRLVRSPGSAVAADGTRTRSNVGAGVVAPASGPTAEPELVDVT